MFDMSAELQALTGDADRLVQFRTALNPKALYNHARD